MSDVSLLYKPCVSHLAKWTTIFAKFKCFDWTPPFANNCMEKCWTMWVVSVWEKRSNDEAKLFDQYQNLFEFVQNAVYCKMMKRERWAKYFATCNAIECFKELIKIAQFYFSVMVHYSNVERFFPWCSDKPKRKRNLSHRTVSTLLKLVCNLKHFSCN